MKPGQPHRGRNAGPNCRFLIPFCILTGFFGFGCRNRQILAPPLPVAQASTADSLTTVVATAELRGVTEPCGCNSDPLGDIARIVGLAKGGLWVDAGSMLYGEPERTSRAVWEVQARLKGRCLAQIYRDNQAIIGIGKDDLSFGLDGLFPSRTALNVAGSQFKAGAEIRSVNGIKLGIFGVVTPARISGLTASDPLPAAKSAITQLRQQGAQVVIALLGMNREEARRLLETAPGIDFGILGAEVGDGLPQPVPVGSGFLLAPADEGRKVVQLRLHVVANSKLQVFDGEFAQNRNRERIEKQIASLTAQLAQWQQQAGADARFIAAKQQELRALTMQAKAPQVVTPPAGSYFTYALLPVQRRLPRDAGVAKSLQDLDAAIGKSNFAAASKQRPTATAGAATYIGMTACAGCHRPAVDFWQKTVHAQAWQTLVAHNKQYNYDCIGCHVTGFQKPGGVGLGTAESAQLTSVQCEVCHGPGSIHVAEAGMETPASLTRKPAAEFCADNCHTKEHSDTFELSAYLRDVLGKGHGENARAALGAGKTGHELRQKALAGVDSP